MMIQYIIGIIDAVKRRLTGLYRKVVSNMAYTKKAKKKKTKKTGYKKP
jgi:hypothetical protein